MNRRDFLTRISITAAAMQAGDALATLIPNTTNLSGPTSVQTVLSDAELAESAPAAGLFPDFTFDRFIEGSANRHARAVAFAFDRNPYSISHPLVIYGDCGLGKTHLMQAIGYKVMSQSPHARVQYVHSWDLRDHIRAADVFREIYDSVDVLLLDDVQCVCLGTGAQAELLRVQADLLRTLDRLTERNSLIVMTAPCLPQEWSTRRQVVAMNSDLLSMIHGSQPVELHSPDFELRVNVLRDKAEQERSPLGNDVLRFIAKNLSTNIRELEGALNRVVAYSRFHGKDISLAVAHEALRFPIFERMTGV